MVCVTALLITTTTNPSISNSNVCFEQHSSRDVDFTKLTRRNGNLPQFGQTQHIMNASAWQSGFPIQPAGFGPPFDGDPQHEDWEDWLRWDPAAEPTSPKEPTLHSGSSKNDSPVQDALLPVPGELFDNANETLAPPMILDEDQMRYDDHTRLGEDAFLFGHANETVTTDEFDFKPLMSLPQPQSGTSRLQTDLGTWRHDIDVHAQGIALSSLTNENYRAPPSAATISSNAPSLHHSPESTSQNPHSIPSDSPPPPRKRAGRKRKADMEQEQRNQSGDSQEDGDERPIKKTSHNVIEKRYRNNLNDKIVELRNSVPSLRATKKANGEEDLEGLTPAHKLNKATVMGKATEYIKHLEKRNKTMSDEMEALKARLAAVETAIGRSRDRQASYSESPTSTNVRPRQTSASSQHGPPSFLTIPYEQWRNNQQMVQQQYMQSQPPPSYARQPNAPAEAQNQGPHVNGRGGGVMNKVMLGTMAGLMMMEGFSESHSDDRSSPRELFAMPTSILRRSVQSPSGSSPQAISQRATLPLLKMCLVVGVVLYLVLPLVSFSPQWKQKARPATVRLPPAPSLASPIEVRRKAWLTAVQTVWVPKHFLLEVVAVTVNMITLSLRRLIGSQAFTSLTGSNKDDEIARIKAWDIAIDAQLAGGDAEVSYYRLLLTLMESGTLPDSPTRLMQKAVHFRVFFWEVANAGYGNMIGFKRFTERVGRFYWESARKQQRELVQAVAEGHPLQENEHEVERLPDHLAGLVEIDCDEVLTDEIVQRAWNLAWNKRSAHRTTANTIRDAVVQDHAIRSPLDAVAAWYTNTIVDETLAESLSEHASSLDTEYHIGLAISVSPPASATLLRALVAKAVLSNSNREANILLALDALPAKTTSSGEMNIVSHIPTEPDVHTALTLAKLLALSAPTASAQAHTRAFDTIAALHISAASFTLLTAVAVYRLLKLLSPNNRRISVYSQQGLEILATNLRVWVGNTSEGLRQQERSVIVETCLDVAKKAGGWGEEDSGYGSGSNRVSPVRERNEGFL